MTFWGSIVVAFWAIVLWETWGNWAKRRKANSASTPAPPQGTDFSQDGAAPIFKKLGIPFPVDARQGTNPLQAAADRLDKKFGISESTNVPQDQTTEKPRQFEATFVPRYRQGNPANKRTPRINMDQVGTIGGTAMIQFAFTSQEIADIQQALAALDDVLEMKEPEGEMSPLRTRLLTLFGKLSH